MSWTKANMAAGAAWGILAHHEVAQLNPKLNDFSGAGKFRIANLRYVNPHASMRHREFKASGLAEKFVAYLFHFYKPGFEALGADTDSDDQLKRLEAAIYDIFLNPSEKTLNDLAMMLDTELKFADEA